MTLNCVKTCWTLMRFVRLRSSLVAMAPVGLEALPSCFSCLSNVLFNAEENIFYQTLTL